jgi:hypothetical protein
LVGRSEAVTKVLERLGVASPSEIWRVAVQIGPIITLRDVNFELYHSTRDPKNPVYKKIGWGKYTLLKKTEREIESS